MFCESIFVISSLVDVVDVVGIDGIVIAVVVITLVFPASLAVTSITNDGKCDGVATGESDAGDTTTGANVDEKLFAPLLFDISPFSWNAGFIFSEKLLRPSSVTPGPFTLPVTSDVGVIDDRADNITESGRPLNKFWNFNTIGWSNFSSYLSSSDLVKQLTIIATMMVTNVPMIL